MLGALRTALASRAPLIAAGAALAVAGCGSAGRDQAFTNSDVAASGCTQDVVTGDRVRISVSIVNRGRQAWPQAFARVASGPGLTLDSMRAAAMTVPVSNVEGAMVYRLGPLAAQATRRVTLDYRAAAPPGGDAGLTAVWGARLPGRAPDGASRVTCAFAVHVRHPPATPAQRRAGSLSLRGPADPHAGFRTGRDFGTLDLPRDSTMHWTALGSASDVRVGATINFEFTSDELSTGSQSTPGATRTDGSHFIAAGSYHQVRIRAIGRWRMTIVPR